MAKLKFKQLQEYATESFSVHATRLNRISVYEDVYKMRWDFKPPEGDWVEPLPSPDPHNTIKGLSRLIIASKPTMKIYADAADADYPERAESIARAMLDAADRRGPWMLMYDIAMSAVLFGEAYVRVANAAENAEFFRQMKDDSMLQRYLRVAMEKPFLMRAYHPGMLVPEYGELGLETMIVKRVLPYRWAANWYGEDKLANALIGQGTLNARDPTSGLWGSIPTTQRTVTVWEVDSHDQFASWVEGATEPIRDMENTLGFLPWAGSIVEGTGLFVAPEDQRLPILYPVVESGYWHAQSYADSIIYSLAMGVGKNPAIVLNLEDPRQPVSDLVDRTTPLSVIRLGLQERALPLEKRVIDQSVQIAKNIADGRMAEMTIPKQVLGMAPDKVMAYSSLNLLVQAGRLPLVPAQRMVGVILGMLLEIPFQWAKARGEVYTIPSPHTDPGGGPLTIDPKDYNHVRFEVKINAQFGDDDAQRVMVAASALQATLWTRERAIEYSGVEEPRKEDSQIRRDLREMAKHQAQVQAQAETMARAMTAAGMAANPPAAQVQPAVVNYRPGEDFLKLCANCAFFRGAGVPCAVVATAIDPIYTCDAWSPGDMSKGSAMPGMPTPPAGPQGIPGMMNPNTSQGGGGVAPIGPMGPGITREAATGRDLAGNPTAAPFGLPIGG